MKDLAFKYRYAWRNNEVRARFCGRTCRIITRGAMNTVLLEFENGEMITTSGNALRKLPEITGTKYTTKTKQK